MDFSSSNFQIVQSKVPYALMNTDGWVTLGLIFALFITLIILVCGMSGAFFGKKGINRFIALIALNVVLLAGSIMIYPIYNVHNTEAKEATLSNVAKWAEAKYPIRVDEKQARELLTRDGEYDWSLEDISSAPNIDTIGSTDVANVDGSKVTKVLLIKVNDEWRIVQYGDGPEYTELKKR